MILSEKEQENIVTRALMLFDQEVARIRRKRHELSKLDAEQGVADAFAAALDEIQESL